MWSRLILLEIMMAIIRPIMPDDVAALYAISLATGFEGAMPHIFTPARR
jgi:hypothetical protein